MTPHSFQRSANPKIYHITHVDNLSRMFKEGALLCDREIVRRGGPTQAIGMSTIKRRRIEELEVDCHPGTKVGDYVPFYFCPRSVMLYVIFRANHPELTYRGGQGRIVHLEADLRGVIRWAQDSGQRWTFSLSNAGAYYTKFSSTREELAKLDWASIAATDFRSAEVMERKQAEFLVYERFPCDLIERVGVESTVAQRLATTAIAGAPRRPPIQVMPEWYFK